MTSELTFSITLNSEFIHGKQRVSMVVHLIRRQSNGLVSKVKTHVISDLAKFLDENPKYKGPMSDLWNSAQTFCETLNAELKLV